MKNFRSHLYQTLSGFWQMGLLWGLAAFCAAVEIAVVRSDSDLCIQAFLAAVIAAYGAVFSTLDPDLSDDVGKLAAYAFIPLTMAMAVGGPTMPLAAAMFFVFVHLPSLAFTAGAGLYRSFQGWLGFDPIEYGMVKAGFGPLGSTSRLVLRWAALVQLAGLFLGSRASADAGSYGNFCLTMLVINAGLGSLAVFYRDPTPD